MDGPVNNPEAAQATPPKAAGLSAYANLSTLLRAAGDREPSFLELELIELLFPLSPSNTVDKAHLEEFLNAILYIAVKWKRIDLCKQAIQRFKDDLSLYVSPNVMSQIINIVGFDIVRPWLNGLAKGGTSLVTRTSLQFVEMLDYLVASSAAPKASREAFRVWAVKRRRKLCSELPDPVDKWENIIHHCLERGGLPYMKEHLLPLYIKAHADKGTFLCNLALQVDAHKAFPDSILTKREIVTELVQASMGNCGLLHAKNCQERVETAYALLLVCCKYDHLGPIPVFFSNLVKTMKRTRTRGNLQAIAIRAVFPFITRLKIEVPTKFSNASVVIQASIDLVFVGVVDAVVNHIHQYDWSDVTEDTGLKFWGWLEPLLVPEEILPLFLRSLDTPLVFQHLEAAPTRVCIHLLASNFAQRIEGSQELTEHLHSIANHYARCADILQDVAEVAKDIVFLGCVVKAPSSLLILQKRIIASGVLVHSGACEDIVCTGQVSQPTSCRCPTELDLIDIVDTVYSATLSGEPLSSELVKKVHPPLVALVHAWFAKHLLSPPPEPMSSALEETLVAMHKTWGHDKAIGRAVHHTLRNFVCGATTTGAQCIIIENLSYQIYKHLYEYLGAHCLDGVATWGTSGNGDIWVRKRHKSMWHPQLWLQLQAYGQRLLGSVTRGPSSVAALGDDFQTLHDAAYKPLAGPPGAIYFPLRLTPRADGSKRPFDVDADGLDSGWPWEETSTDDEIPPPKKRPEPLPSKKRRID